MTSYRTGGDRCDPEPGPHGPRGRFPDIARPGNGKGTDHMWRMTWKVGFAVLLGMGACATADAPAPTTWAASLAVRAGAMDGPGALSGVWDLEVGPEGQLLVVQTSVGSITVFDSTGQYLRTLGRRGRGPGEFSRLSRVGWTRDTLWVMDIGKLHLFDRQLRYVRTIQPVVATPPAGADRVVPGPIMADGSILGIPIAYVQRDREPLALLTDSGAVTRVLAEVATDHRSADVKLNGHATTIANPWAADTRWFNASDGRSLVAVERPAPQSGERARFTILRIGLNGDTLVHRSVEYTPIPLEAAARDRVYRELATRLSRIAAVTAAEMERQIRADLSAPAYHVPVTDLVTGRDGTIWLRREEVAGDSVAWEVYDQAGDLRGRLRLPAGLRVYRAQTERIWGVVTDSLDVPFVEVYRVTGGVES